MPEWPKGAVSKKAVPVNRDRGFKSLSLRHLKFLGGGMRVFRFFDKNVATVDSRVLRNGQMQTPPGPEGSNGKHRFPCAAGVPGYQQSPYSELFFQVLSYSLSKTLLNQN